MGTILDRILLEKQKEVKILKENRQVPSNNPFAKFSLVQHLEQTNCLAVISEFKRASPSKGDINIYIDPVDQAKGYEKSGASAISVLTDKTFFKGSFEDLQAVRKAVNLPILCKDFIIDKIQIDYAKENGANVILLIAAALPKGNLIELFEYAIQQDLEVLLEVHDEMDVEKALEVKPQLIGINNRNLKTFEVCLGVTEQLAPILRQSCQSFIISESGIFTKKDAERVREAGASGVLVGESLMKSNDITGAMKELKVPLLKGVI